MALLNSRLSIFLTKSVLSKLNTTVNIKNSRYASFYNIDDNLFGLSDEQQQVRLSMRDGFRLTSAPNMSRVVTESSSKQYA